MQSKISKNQKSTQELGSKLNLDFTVPFASEIYNPLTGFAINPTNMLGADIVYAKEYLENKFTTNLNLASAQILIETYPKGDSRSSSPFHTVICPQDSKLHFQVWQNGVPIIFRADFDPMTLNISNIIDLNAFPVADLLTKVQSEYKYLDLAKHKVVEQNLWQRAQEELFIFTEAYGKTNDTNYLQQGPYITTNKDVSEIYLLFATLKPAEFHLVKQNTNGDLDIQSKFYDSARINIEEEKESWLRFFDQLPVFNHITGSFSQFEDDFRPLLSF